MRLQSYVSGAWETGNGAVRALVNPVTGEVLAEATSSGLDLLSAVEFARTQGCSALQQMSFAQRGEMLKRVAGVLTANRDKYFEIARLNSGNTKLDASIDIDGGIGTLSYYAKIGKNLGDGNFLCEPGEDQLAKEPVFFSRHCWISRPGVAVQINAFNFPSWGMWEKVAAATLSGAPSMVKPATATSLLSYQMMHDVIEAGVVPEGVFNIICGSGEGLLEAVGAMDSIAFTGSASTANYIRSVKNVQESGARVTVEADSVNAMIVGPDATPGSEIFKLAVREAVKALSVKAGQLCTNIRRIFVPQSIASEFSDAVIHKVEGLITGDPIDENVNVGPLVNRQQQLEAFEGINKLKQETKVLTGGGEPGGLSSEVSAQGAFVAPTLLLCSDPEAANAVHEVEVFGPCSTIMPYGSFGSALEMAIKGGGALALSLFSNDPEVQAGTFNKLGSWHGRILIVDDVVGKKHTGHAIVMPQCVHGGPGRAGGGEELGGIRGLRFHMQRTAIQGSGKAFEALGKTAEATL